MIVCKECDRGILAIGNRRIYHWMCRLRKRYTVQDDGINNLDYEHGIGLFKLCQCIDCEKWRWGLRMKHDFHCDHWKCADHYHVINICRGCFRKRYRKLKERDNDYK